MVKKQKQPEKTCADCIHESACRAWVDGRYIADSSASKCPNFETVQESAAYLCGVLEERKRKQTNADRIRSMSDEELAKIITDIAFDMYNCNECQPEFMTMLKSCDVCDNKCSGCVLKWLKQPAEPPKELDPAEGR